ncbi:kinase-like protein [Clavulina sp. PMI_390]|nr:kinase-like protein [Clavulina sp. PMI_390]
MNSPIPLIPQTAIHIEAIAQAIIDDAITPCGTYYRYRLRRIALTRNQMISEHYHFTLVLELQDEDGPRGTKVFHTLVAERHGMQCEGSGSSSSVDRNDTIRWSNQSPRQDADFWHETKGSLSGPYIASNAIIFCFEDLHEKVSLSLHQIILAVRAVSLAGPGPLLSHLSCSEWAHSVLILLYILRHPDLPLQQIEGCKTIPLIVRRNICEQYLDLSRQASDPRHRYSSGDYLSCESHEPHLVRVGPDSSRTKKKRNHCQIGLCRYKHAPPLDLGNFPRWPDVASRGHTPIFTETESEAVQRDRATRIDLVSQKLDSLPHKETFSRLCSYYNSMHDFLIRSRKLWNSGDENSFRILAQQKSEDLSLFLEYLFQRAESCHFRPTNSRTIRIIQDMLNKSGRLPNGIWLSGIEVAYKKPIGKGGEATLYAARYKNSKVVVRKVIMEEKAIKMVHRELLTHYLLTHPCVISLLGVMEHSDGSLMAVTPLIENEYSTRTCPSSQCPSASSMHFLRMASFLNDSRLPDFTLDILLGVAQAVEYMHINHGGTPIIHGDLHPDNVLINSHGQAILCDFGHSRIFHKVPRNTSIVLEGGVQRYLAPELTSGVEFRTTMEWRPSFATDRP